MSPAARTRLLLLLKVAGTVAMVAFLLSRLPLREIEEALQHPRWGWHASGLQGTSSGPMTVVVCEHQYWAVGEETRRFTCSRPTT